MLSRKQIVIISLLIGFILASILIPLSLTGFKKAELSQTTTKYTTNKTDEDVVKKLTYTPLLTYT